MPLSKEKSVLQLRIQEKIQKVLLEMFRESDLSFCGKRFFISITTVDISPNLRNLKVSIDILNTDEKAKIKIIQKLNKENIFAIKDLIAKKVNLRYVPEVVFILDNSEERSYNINKIIEKESEKFGN